MRLAHFVTVALLAVALPSSILPACGHLPPNPGQVAVSCTMEAVHDPAVIERVLAALEQSDFRSKLAGIIATIPGVTSEVVACIVRSFMGRLGADPARAKSYANAHTYLQEHGYEAP